MELVLERLTVSGSEEVSNFRLRPGAGEAARETGGDGGRADGGGGGNSASIYYDRCMRWKVDMRRYKDEPQDF